MRGLIGLSLSLLSSCNPFSLLRSSVPPSLIPSPRMHRLCVFSARLRLPFTIIFLSDIAGVPIGTRDRVTFQCYTEKPVAARQKLVSRDPCVKPVSVGRFFVFWVGFVTVSLTRKGHVLYYPYILTRWRSISRDYLVTWTEKRHVCVCSCIRVITDASIHRVSSYTHIS